MGEIFRWEHPAKGLPFTGERFTSETSGQIEIEHLHRYFLARELSRGKEVLDIAAGEGYGSALIAQVAKSVVGVELDADAVAYATRSYGRSNLNFFQGDARAIPLDPASVDVVVSFETIEHLHEQETFLAEVRRVLRPDGVFIVSTPDRDVYSPPDSPANPFHVRELTLPEFEQALRRHFPHVSFLLQRPMLGSVLLPSGGVATTQQAFTFERRGDDHFEGSIGLPRAVYAVALVSAFPIPLPAASLYVETSGIGLRLNEIAQERATNARLETLFAAAKSDNERLEGLLADARTERERLQGLLADSCTECERLEGLHVGERTERERLEGLLGDGRSECERLERLLADGRADRERLEGLLAERRSERERLEGLLADGRSERERLEGLLADGRSERERLEGLLADGRSERERLEGLLADGRSENGRLTSLIGDLEVDRERLEGLLTEARSEIERESSVLETLKTNNERLETELSASKIALLHADAERQVSNNRAAEASSRLRLIEASVSWRVLAPARWLGQRFLRGRVARSD